MNKKKQLVITLISVLTFNTYSQIKFEKGYFIDNNSVKTECLIKNIDWGNNPTKFDYKLNESSPISEENINTVKEFAVKDLKFTRFLVNIDRSSEQTSKLSDVRTPIFKKETLFLKSLVEGIANLYFYHDVSLNRYFYGFSNAEVTQLIFKSYTTEYYKIKENNRFKQQLLKDLTCSSISKKEIKKIKYKKKDLIEYFIRYNNCNNSTSINYVEKNENDLFNLNIRLGINSTSLSIRNDVSSFRNTDFNNELNFRFGIESEFILPFNKNKWAALIEPTFQYYKSEIKIENQTDAVVDYKSIEFQIGIRHYFFLNDTSKVFANGLFVYDLPLDSTVRNLDIESAINFALGIGYNYKGKYSLELRYLTSREVLNNYTSWHSNYETLSVIFGYKLF